MTGVSSYDSTTIIVPTLKLDDSLKNPEKNLPKSNLQPFEFKWKNMLTEIPTATMNNEHITIHTANAIETRGWVFLKKKKKVSILSQKSLFQAKAKNLPSHNELEKTATTAIDDKIQSLFF